MRITNSDREAFVRSAMDDVPEVDYSEQAMSIIVKHLKSTVPVDLQSVIAKYPDWFAASVVHMPAHISNFTTRLGRGYVDWDDLGLSAEDTLKIREIAVAAKAQYDARTDLTQKLRGAINACGTLKQALETLPEFAKYLPQERDGKVTRSVPAITNLATDMANMGWPKGRAPAHHAGG